MTDIWMQDPKPEEVYGNEQTEVGHTTRNKSWKDKTRKMIDSEKEKKRAGLGELVVNLAENTGMHGMPNVRRATSVTRKLFWCVILLVGLGALIAHVTSNVIYFYTRPTDTSFTLLYTPEIFFPAVSVCNMNPIRKSALSSAGADMRKLLDTSYDPDSSSNQANTSATTMAGGSSSTVTGGNSPTTSGPPVTSSPASTNGVTANATSNNTASTPNFFSWDDHDYTETSSDFQKRQQFTDLYASMPPDGRKEVGHNISWFLLDCSWQGLPCGPVNFTWFTNYLYGNCYTFNSGVNASVLKVRKPGPLYGLSLKFYIEQNEYLAETTDSAGVRVVIHNQTDMAFPEENGFTISPGYSSQIGLTLSLVERTDQPYGKCKNFTQTENKKVNGFSTVSPSIGYSRPACQKTCYQLGVINHCKCADASYPFQGEAFTSISGSDVNPCWTANNSVADCIDDVQEMYKTGHLGCEETCPPPCLEVSYPRTQSAALWPSDATQNSILEQLGKRDAHLWHMLYSGSWGPGERDAFLRKNVAKLDVYLSDFNFEYVQTKASYDGIKLLSDIGGSVGLWLGFSVITVFEFIEFFMDIVRAITFRYANKNRKSVGANG